MDGAVAESTVITPCGEFHDVNKLESAVVLGAPGFALLVETGRRFRTYFEGKRGKVSWRQIIMQ